MAKTTGITRTDNKRTSTARKAPKKHCATAAAQEITLENAEMSLPEPVFADDNPALLEPPLDIEEVDRVMRWLTKWSRLDDTALGCMANSARCSIAGMLYNFHELVENEEAA